MCIMKVPEEKAFEMVRKIGAEVPKFFFCRKESEMERVVEKLSFPFVLKVSGRKIVHKSDVKGVSIVHTREEALREFGRLKKIKGCEKVLVQEFIRGVETIVGVKKDDTFGYAILFGLGGMFTEIFHDVSLRVCPIAERDAEEMLEEIKGKEILKGYRGVRINRKKLVDILVRLSKAAEKWKIREMDINPLICNEKACYAVDLRIFR